MFGIIFGDVVAFLVEFSEDWPGVTPFLWILSNPYILGASAGFGLRSFIISRKVPDVLSRADVLRTIEVGSFHIKH